MNPLHIIVKRIEEERLQIALGAVERPSSDPLLTGTAAGRYAGLGDALSIIAQVTDEESDS